MIRKPICRMTGKYNLILGIAVVATNFISSQAEDFCEKQNSIHFPEGNGRVGGCRNSSTYINNISCKIYNFVNINCTWDMEANAPKDIQYCFVLRIKRTLLPCSQYLTNEENETIGCHIKDVAFKDKPKISLQFSNTKCQCQCQKKFKVSDIEMMKPPINITKQSQNGKEIIKWSRSPTVQLIKNNACFEYELKVWETDKDVLFRNLTTSKTEHTFDDLDKDKQYSVQIRGRKIKNCGLSKFWGEWSEPLFIGEDKKKIPGWIFPLICIIVMVFVLGTLLYLLKRYTLTFFTAVIPDPSSKLKFWFSSSELYFQKCAVPAQHECVPISEIEIVTVDSSMDSAQCGQGH
ncbi:hypothetical protein XENTR_v10005198 [Xenopus tropicalis]|uniref:Interleukin-5 receptor subunit alpha-like n=1 Tax=Xenopus tropicalis TaxID=8364 RepID=A0A803JIT8_XENTR|nr:interleukin-5 receptor subunit alpha-like [Xenopus tropicalis]KAE8622334.1 hypothetical protein XENTR_v10005198 [Xenopus tropicalis]